MALVTIFYRVATTMFDDTNVCYLRSDAEGAGPLVSNCY